MARTLKPTALYKAQRLQGPTITVNDATPVVTTNTVTTTTTQPAPTTQQS